MGSCPRSKGGVVYTRSGPQGEGIGDEARLLSQDNEDMHMKVFSKVYCDWVYFLCAEVEHTLLMRALVTRSLWTSIVLEWKGDSTYM